MGCNSSKDSLIASPNGDGRTFLDTYDVDRILGRGEFGVVKLIYNKNNPNTPLACKVLRKGMQFKDNTLYSAIKPNILRVEVNILRALKGTHHNLNLIGVYESPSVIYIVTDYLELEMLQYVTSCYGESGIRTEDVSRIAFELFDAIDHCTKNGVIHRDIKPENIMFKNGSRGASLSLIDYGSGTLEIAAKESLNTGPDTERETIEQSDGKMLLQHTTFAGSAFYISPEMFKKKYTSKTDVWSAGVTLYVLVAGYPADALQKAFNMLQDSKEPEKRKEALKELPNVGKEIPETFWEMLEMCLTYRQKNRSDAKAILLCEFVNFHKQIGESSDIGLSLDDVLKDASYGHKNPTESSVSGKGGRTASILIEGSVHQHNRFLRYDQFERSLTTLIATKLNQNDLEALLSAIDQFIGNIEEVNGKDNKSPVNDEVIANKKRLQIIKVEVLKTLLEKRSFHSIIKDMDRLSKGEHYDKFAYHVAFLREFARYSDIDQTQEVTNVREPSSVHGGSVWESFKRKKEVSMKGSVSDAALNNSAHN